MAIAGHVSPKMLDHYSHVRMQAKRQALDSLSEKASVTSKEAQPAMGYGTKNVTNSKPERVPFSQVIEKNGGDDETRTRDLCRDSAAWIGFTTTYNNAGTAKLPVSRTRLHELWVGLWVGKSCRWPRARRTGNPLPNGLVSSCTPPVDLLYTEPHGSV